MPGVLTITIDFLFQFVDHLLNCSYASGCVHVTLGCCDKTHLSSEFMSWAQGTISISSCIKHASEFAVKGKNALFREGIKERQEIRIFCARSIPSILT